MVWLIASKALIFTAALSLALGQIPQSLPSSAESPEIQNLLREQLDERHLVGIAAIVFRSHTIIGIAAVGVKHQGETRAARIH